MFSGRHWEGTARCWCLQLWEHPWTRMREVGARAPKTPWALAATEHCSCKSPWKRPPAILLKDAAGNDLSGGQWCDEGCDEDWLAPDQHRLLSSHQPAGNLVDESKSQQSHRHEKCQRMIACVDVWRVHTLYSASFCRTARNPCCTGRDSKWQRMRLQDVALIVRTMDADLGDRIIVVPAILHHHHAGDLRLGAKIHRKLSIFHGRVPAFTAHAMTACNESKSMIINCVAGIMVAPNVACGCECARNLNILILTPNRRSQRSGNDSHQQDCNQSLRL